MKKLSLKMVAMTAAMMMCLTASAKTEDVGGRVIDAQGEPLPFVSVALLTADSTYIQGAICKCGTAHSRLNLYTRCNE